jgi:hypothetical protein
MMDHPRVIVFAKYPDPGRVKTRMVPPLTHEQAARLHQACLEAVLEQVLLIKGIDVRLAVSPDDKVSALSSAVGITPGRCQPQGEGDLGARLRRAMTSAFDEGASAVLFLGSDSPTLPVDHIRDAIAKLRPEAQDTSPADAVMGPCVDGGYYLLGLSRPIPSLFEGVDWGSERVADQTRARAGDAGIRSVELPTWHDVDRFEDLRQVHDDFAGLRASSPLPNASQLDSGRLLNEIGDSTNRFPIEYPKALALAALISGLLWKQPR